MDTIVVDVVRLLDKNKSVVAFFTPFLLTVLGVAGTWVETGVFNGQEVRLSVAGLITSAATALAVWAAKTRQAEVRRPDIVAAIERDPA
jgi:hypothetical protein